VRILFRFHKPLTYVDYYKRAYDLIRADPADVYHAHDLNTLPVAAALSRRTGGRLVYDAHELYPQVSTLSRVERWVWRQVERVLIRRAEVVTVCESIAAELHRKYPVRAPVVLLNCPPRHPRAEIRAARVALRDRIGLSDPDVPVVLYQGGFAPHRGLEQLICAAAEIYPGIVVLMGWGRLEPDLRELVKSRGLQERVLITAPVPPAELIGISAGADVGVIPYRAVGLNNYYTTPNKLFEFMAAGLPIAGSRFPELIRFVEGLRIGLTFDPEDPSDMAGTINSLIADPPEREAMAARSRAAHERFNWDGEGVKLAELYRSLDGSPQRA
jgi:glycosyltransferase involved in cell wall biosynthesis